MTPKWAFQHRVDGILRFLMLMPPASAPYCSPTQHALIARTAAPNDPCYTTGDRGKVSPANSSKKQQTASKKLRIRASRSLRSLGIDDSCMSGLKPVRHTCPSRLHAAAGLMHERYLGHHRGGMAAPWLANHICQRQPAFLSVSILAAGDRRHLQHDRTPTENASKVNTPLLKGSCHCTLRISDRARE
ncbi:hypothetical protein V8C37DRAFT_191149 [Trichoderma ceciliae]